MRPQVVASVLLTAVTLLGVLALRSNWFHSSAVLTPADTMDVLPAQTVPATSGESNLARPTPAPAATLSGTADPARAQIIRQRVADLEQLAMQSDVASRDAILAELTNAEKAIRQAALEAAIQFNDRSVIPRLKEVAAETDDDTEKAALLEAIDYINLPSLTEYLAARNAQMAAGGLTNRSLPGTNRPGRHGRLSAPPTPSTP